MKTFEQVKARRRGDRGDSLIEVLFAVVIIALAAGPLIGALLESIAASAEHRGLATTGTLLESFAETAVSEIQTSPLPGTAYQPTTTTPSYRLLSNPSKTSGPPGTTVTVFVTGFTLASSFTVHVGKTSATVDAVKTYGNGNARITFTIPVILKSTTTHAITVTGSTSASVTSLNGTGFQVTAPTPSTPPVKTPYKGYEITVAPIKCWKTTSSPNAFSTCSPADHSTGLQYLTFSASGPSGSLGSLGVVVRDPNRT
jgi:type II secretory pathway pseudopilin PulG